MQRIGVVLFIANLLFVTECRQETYIADERRDTQTGDTSSEPDEVPGSQSDMDTRPDTTLDTDTGAADTGDTSSDSEPQPLQCTGKTATPGDVERTVLVGGVSRSYLLHIPDAYNGSDPVSLIVDYHAIGGTGATERTASPYPPVTDPEGVVMAFPTGLPGTPGTAWNIGPCCVDNVDDVTFTWRMIEDIEAIACIDASRIYAVGISMGGGMAYHLACQPDSVFAAIAPSSFDLIQRDAESCAPPGPVSVVSFRATGDPLVPYSGGYSAVIPDHPVTFLGAVETFNKWGEINGCAGSVQYDGNGCQFYGAAQCQGGAEVMLCTEQVNQVIYGNVSIAWPILKRHSLP